ncbi:MAG: long-chain fatty acid--CoA ligase [Burkholderiaceae bacterium]|nr:long-chain fatty acid--CoA ligase [Burkholderiaceae bacterium]
MRYLWNMNHEFEQARREMAPPLAGETVQAMFWNAVELRRDQVWLRHKKLGIWRAWTWRQTGDRVAELAAGLMALGMGIQDRVAIIANTRLEWLLADLAILSAAGTTVGVYPTDSPEQLTYVLNDSSARFLFVEDEEQLDKALSVLETCPGLDRIIVIDEKGLSNVQHEKVLGLSALIETGRETLAQQPDLLTRRLIEQRTDHLAILVYTSGTTGKPKGAMHHQAGLVYAIRAHSEIIQQTPQDERMCFLPLCHIAERIGGTFISLYTGSKINFVENPDTVPENIREIAPTVVLAVPRVWEKFQSGVRLAVSESTPLQQRMFNAAITLGLEIADAVLRGESIPWHQRWRYRIAQWLVLANVRKSIGLDRARCLLTGAAPISPELIRWFYALGIPMLEIWGMTETCGGSSANTPGAVKLGSIGRAAAHNEMRIDSQTGEILVRGKNIFSGYLNQLERTAETFTADGWLRTGDVARVDAEGFFTIVDRIKDIIITAGGKNITPSELENELKASPYVTDAVVIGDKRPFLTAIIMIDHDNVEHFALSRDVRFTNYESLTQAPEVIDLIAGEVEAVNQRVARVEQIKKFRLLAKKLSPEDEEVTPTMKLKRKLVLERYAAMIEEMYSGG